jgi:thiamine monophosphate synthase
MAQYNAIQQARQAKQAKLAAQQAQQLANATYVLIKPSKANITRVKVGVSPAQQAQINANLAATLVLQLYPLVAQSGLTPQQAQQVSQALLKSVYVLQGAANLPQSKLAVQQILPPAQPQP